MPSPARHVRAPRLLSPEPAPPVTPTATSGARVSVVIVVHNQIGLTRACLESLRQTTRPFELCVVDNGLRRRTEASSARVARAPPLRYQRNAENVGLIRALNQGAALAGGDRLCFLHNDTEMREPRWLERLQRRGGPGRGSAWPGSTGRGACAATAATWAGPSSTASRGGDAAARR